MADAVQVLTNVPLEVLEAEIARCDVAICLRWPIAGEVSALLMRALAAGKPAIVSDFPSTGNLDPTLCWKVPIDPPKRQANLSA